MPKKHGHYCRVYGEYKSNESFSGRGHNAHICKKCAAMPVEERSAQMAITKIQDLPFRLSEEQKAWLRKRMHDMRPDVAELASEVYAMRFPYAVRNEQQSPDEVDDKSVPLTE